MQVSGNQVRTEITPTRNSDAAGRLYDVRLLRKLT